MIKYFRVIRLKGQKKVFTSVLGWFFFILGGKKFLICHFPTPKVFSFYEKINPPTYKIGGPKSLSNFQKKTKKKQKM